MPKYISYYNTCPPCTLVASPLTSQVFSSVRKVVAFQLCMDNSILKNILLSLVLPRDDDWCSAPMPSSWCCWGRPVPSHPCPVPYVPSLRKEEQITEGRGEDEERAWLDWGGSLLLTNEGVIMDRPEQTLYIVHCKQTSLSSFRF